MYFMNKKQQKTDKKLVLFAEAPLAGAWIEIEDLNEEWVPECWSPSRRGVNWNGNSYFQCFCQFWSPSRRGVNWNNGKTMKATVWQEAPLAGAWIEISQIERELYPSAEAPLAGAWIEI